jgi:hypothetical protein
VNEVRRTQENACEKNCEKSEAQRGRDAAKGFQYWLITRLARLKSDAKRTHHRNSPRADVDDRGSIHPSGVSGRKDYDGISGDSRVVREKRERLKARQGARRLIIATPWRSQRAGGYFLKLSYQRHCAGLPAGEGKLRFLLMFGIWKLEQAGQRVSSPPY